MTQLTIRELLLMLYQAAVDGVDGQYLVQRWFARHPQRFSHCIAIGKAAPAMLQGALHARPSFSSSSIPRFLLISPPRQISRGLRKNSAIQCVASSHPLPDEKSLQAQALEKANAGMVLMATDDLIQTGPTNTNVMDIVITYVPANGNVTG